MKYAYWRKDIGDLNTADNSYDFVVNCLDDLHWEICLVLLKNSLNPESDANFAIAITMHFPQ